MREFFNWVNGVDTPIAVPMFVYSTLIVFVLGVFMAALVYESIALFAAPFVVGAWLVWKEYMGRRKGD